MSSDSGLLDNKTQAELDEYMHDLGCRFEFGCLEDGDPISCHSFAQWIETYKRRTAKCAEILKENCLKRNYGPSCFKYANFRLIGKPDVTRDPLDAFRMVEHGCNAGKDSKCCMVAGRLVAEGISSHSSSLETALPLFEKACQLGSADGCFHLGGAAFTLCQQKMEAVSSSTDSEAIMLREKARNAWMEACRLGNHYACYNLAKMYTSGDGVQASVEKANEFVKKADELLAAKRVTEKPIPV